MLAATWNVRVDAGSSMKIEKGHTPLSAARAALWAFLPALFVGLGPEIERVSTRK